MSVEPWQLVEKQHAMTLVWFWKDDGAEDPLQLLECLLPRSWRRWLEWGPGSAPERHRKVAQLGPRVCIVNPG